MVSGKTYFVAGQRGGAVVTVEVVCKTTTRGAVGCSLRNQLGAGCQILTVVEIIELSISGCVRILLKAW